MKLTAITFVGLILITLGARGFADGLPIGGTGGGTGGYPGPVYDGGGSIPSGPTPGTPIYPHGK